MSEIVFDARSFASAKSKSTISEHAQEHALGSSKMLRIFDCAQKPNVSDISPGVLDIAICRQVVYFKLFAFGVRISMSKVYNILSCNT